MKARKKILVVDVDPQFLKEFKNELGLQYEVESCNTGKAALGLFKKYHPQVLIIDEAVVDMTIVEVLQAAGEHVVKIITTKALPENEMIFSCIDSKQAHTCFVKPLNYSELKNVIERVSAFDGGAHSADANVDPVYQKVSTILDKVNDAEIREKTAKIQIEKARKLEEESLARVQWLDRDVKQFKDKIKELDKEMLAWREKAKHIEDQNEILVKEKEKIQDSLKEIEIQIEATSVATVKVSPDLKGGGREKIDGKNAVLFVDDEEDVRGLCETVFRTVFKVYVAESADAAMASLQQHPEIALVVTDFRMPKKTGINLATEARKAYPDLPIFLLTGYGEMDLAIKAMNEGVIQQYYAKPFVTDQMIEAIRTAIEKSEETVVQKTLVQEKKALVVDRIRELVAKEESLQYNYSKLREEHGRTQKIQEKMASDLSQAKTESAELRVSVGKERETLRVEMTEKARKADAEISKKLEEASRLIEVEKQKNKDELVLLEKKFKEDKEKVEQHLEEMRKQMASEKQLVEQQVLEERKKGEAELVKIKESIANMKAKIEEDIRKELEAKKKAVEAEIDAKKKAVEAEIEALKKTVTKDLDRANAELQQATRELRSKDEELQTRVRSYAELEKEVQQTKLEKNKALKECEAMKGEYEFIVQSRASLEAEINELKGVR